MPASPLPQDAPQEAMNRERWLRSSDEAAAFDWLRLARELEVPAEIARELYRRAMQLVNDADPQRVETLYVRWLRAAGAARRPAKPSLTPGRKTRVMQEMDKASGSQPALAAERLE